MVHWHLKTCVLSLCVAVLCNDRAFGEGFWCEECKKYISREDWGCHREKEHVTERRNITGFLSVQNLFVVPSVAKKFP